MAYTESDCVKALQRVANDIGHSPSRLEYRSVVYYDDLPSPNTIHRIFGSWTDAKVASGLEPRTSLRTELNEDYFETIDSAEKAYWLGFLYADGSISDQPQLTVSVAKSDRYLVEQFAKSVRSKYQIYEKEYENPAQNQIATSIGNPKFCNDLIELGCDGDKTNSDRIPDLGAGYVPSFIRGFFDGDGSFTYREDEQNGSVHPRPSWSIHSKSTVRLEWIAKHLRSFNVRGAEIYHGNDSKRLMVSRATDLKYLWKTLYKNDFSTNPALDRKRYALYGAMHRLESIDYQPQYNY